VPRRSLGRMPKIPGCLGGELLVRSHISTVKKSCGWCALIPHHKRTPPETDWKRINTSSLHRSEIDSPKEKKQMDLARAGEV